MSLKFQAEDFINKYLNKGAKLADKQLFADERERLRRMMGNNPLHYASKDDLFMLLTETVPKFCKVSAMHQEGFIARPLALWLH
jgi:hypothetical protein